MTGSVQIKKDRYYTVINIPDGEGGYRKKWETTGLPLKGNKRRAEQILKDRLAKYESQHEILDVSDILFSRFMEAWLDVVKPQVEPSTYNTYRLVVQNTIMPYFRALGVKLKDLQPIHIQKFYNKKLKDGVSANTVKHYHANIHKALNYAVKARMLMYNPASLVELPKRKQYVAKL